MTTALIYLQVGLKGVLVWLAVGDECYQLPGTWRHREGTCLEAPDLPAQLL
jgi:hypothetical protein